MKASLCCMMARLADQAGKTEPVCLDYNPVGAPRGEDHGYCFLCGHDKGCHGL